MTLGVHDVPWNRREGPTMTSQIHNRTAIAPAAPPIRVRGPQWAYLHSPLGVRHPTGMPDEPRKLLKTKEGSKHEPTQAHGRPGSSFGTQSPCGALAPRLRTADRQVPTPLSPASYRSFPVRNRPQFGGAESEPPVEHIRRPRRGCILAPAGALESRVLAMPLSGAEGTRG